MVINDIKNLTRLSLETYAEAGPWEAGPLVDGTIYTI